MENKLQKLKDRLSDLSKRNRLLRLLKLYDKWTFDLGQFKTRSTEILHKLSHKQGPIHLASIQSSDETEQRSAQRLLSLYRNVTALEEETGSYNVFVGYPFITGRFPDDTYIQAPVFLFPVEFKTKQQEYEQSRQSEKVATVLNEERAELLMRSTKMINMSSPNQRTPLEPMQPIG
ncbi:DUF4011 domain-containing protein [Desulfosporosinus sp. BICA1-9]|uniref:DUF4011 domain-containing protein n=1 Tax=Desulfosporosinus sp. BICA1-9 TaxID=1531958 RepID=UPI00054BBE86|nr:DUF4011 domain-containing protein [Desulfosporosinus sp. BICA1-9]KJS87556.1 MAG: hypothetical protein JL57_13895 [Desulfosporosinus sp. BICA1-9]HBW35986.1 DUF4011 domain-containing protein [Desulfosporosinus sp.]